MAAEIRRRARVDRCRLTRPACASDCLAEPSIRPTPRIARLACWRCSGSGSIASGGSSRRAIRSRTRAALRRCQRVAAARALAHHPRIDVTDFEAKLGTHYSYETVAYLVRRCPGVRFVWIMGADNLRSFHRWQRWRDIAETGADRGRRSARPKPLRVGQRRRPGLARFRLPESAALTLAGTKAAGLDLSAWAEIAAVLDGAAGGTGLAKQLKLLTGRAYLRSAPARSPGPSKERKDKDPCPLLPSLGPTVACPKRSPECVLTPRRSSAWSSRASTT